MSDREIMEAKGLGSSNKYKTSPSRFPIPEIDPQTGERNPYYEELTSKKSIHNPELYNQTSGKKVKFDTEFTTYMPNQKWHRYISFIKSGVRILGYGLLIINLPIAVGVLIFSEVIGIIEELV